MKIKVMNIRSKYKVVVLDRLLMASYKGNAFDQVMERLLAHEMITSSRMGDDTVLLHTESRFFAQSRIVIGRMTAKTRWFDNREVKLIILLLVATARNTNNQTMINQVNRFYNSDYLAELVNSGSPDELALKL
ncbi:hypothetical protein EQG49_09450 [Periweissella cryptocerci]|uniref:PTS EIIA type-2 domain-containing protein n=1 Tax=Periweissella cryptocerci TaxID=2506420 RepID=A0A4P6YV39_9LACO|nr:PTS sugar transporter subunit IIA [Periweissella cryptocerci]QBO36668.1 hypothetical protein EQG49_09450 [Periweissella cryptocerci]